MQPDALKPSRFFVSFSSRDLKYVREIMAALSGQGLDYWDYADIRHSIEMGRRIEGRLAAEIDACTHMVVVISANSANRTIGRFCRLELEYAQKAPRAPFFIPVLLVPESQDSRSDPDGLPAVRRQRFGLWWRIGARVKQMLLARRSPSRLRLSPPYAIFKDAFCQELDNSPKSIVAFTVKVCQLLGKVYVPPIEAHPSLPFWKLFRKEVEEMAHSNREHVDLMMILGEFNLHYRKSETLHALFLINHFIERCTFFNIHNRAFSYRPFYPLIVKAVCETELGQYDEAMKSYEAARALAPQDQDVIGGIGTVLFKTRRYCESAACFERIIRENRTEDMSNAKINLIAAKQAMETPITDDEERFLFDVDIRRFSDDLKTAVLNIQAVQLRITRKNAELERHCLAVIDKGLHDSITVRLLQLSYLNRGLRDRARSAVLRAQVEAANNPRLDKDLLKTFLEDS